MKTKVFMSPNNGNLCAALPLYQVIVYESEDDFTQMIEYNLLVYAIDIGEDSATFMSAEWVDNNLIDMGEL